MTPPAQDEVARELLAVTQADREAAADLALEMQMDATAYVVRKGKGNADDRPLTQAFARHRIQAALSPQGGIEGVAQLEARNISRGLMTLHVLRHLKDLHDAADKLTGEIDLQTYEEKRKLEDWPEDHQFDVSLPSKLITALDAAICRTEALLRTKASNLATLSPPTLDPTLVARLTELLARALAYLPETLGITRDIRDAIASTHGDQP